MKFFRGGLLGLGLIVSKSDYTSLGLDCLLSLGAYSVFVFHLALTKNIMLAV